MTDPRLLQLTDLIINHSLKLKPGESVLLEAFDAPPEAVGAMAARICQAGALPYVAQRSQTVQRQLLLHGGEELMKLTGAIEVERMKAVDAYIGLRASENISELSDVPSEQMKLYTTHVAKPVHFDLRVPRGRWVVLRYPNSAMAQMAGLSTAAFEEFYYQVCTVDYQRLGEALVPLVERLDRADRVRLAGPGTDLEFSIQGIPVVPCAGEYNLPDGEVFTAPVRDSINGRIQFNAPTIYHGVSFDNLALTFRDGRVVEATGSDTKRLNEILDTDEGARYVGEFAIGVNPRITRAMRDILFDEKIAGSIHLTPGNAYDEADNGNRSQVHWDLVLLQDAANGGGELWLDGELIRQDGVFITDELRALNPGEGW